MGGVKHSTGTGMFKSEGRKSRTEKAVSEQRSRKGDPH